MTTTATIELRRQEQTAERIQIERVKNFERKVYFAMGIATAVVTSMTLITII